VGPSSEIQRPFFFSFLAFLVPCRPPPFQTKFFSFQFRSFPPFFFFLEMDVRKISWVGNTYLLLWSLLPRLGKAKIIRQSSFGPAFRVSETLLSPPQVALSTRRHFSARQDFVFIGLSIFTYQYPPKCSSPL